MNLQLLVMMFVLVLGYFGYVFWPQNRIAAPVEKTRLDYLRERRDVIYENLRDLNFEFRSGKFPEDDYARQRETLEIEAGRVVSEIDKLDKPGG
jgi:hypothetical protein